LRIPRTPPGVRILLAYSFQGYAKNAYPWLSSCHRSAVQPQGMVEAEILKQKKDYATHLERYNLPRLSSFYLI